MILNMKKFLVLFISAILLAPIFSIGLNAEVLGDPNDLLTVVTPSPNQRVGGSINITWYMFDNNQNVIPYKINLYDAATCRTTNFGQINSTNNGVSSTTQLNSIAWNTRTTLSTANLVDGSYCLKICLAMKNGSGNYAACNARYVKIVNNNRAPTITSVPSNLIIKESDTWTYQVKATDPDNDPITYKIVAGVPFLSINQLTGVITTNAISKTLPAGVNRADYNIIVSADDSFAGAVTQQFTLTIIKDTSVGVPPPTTTPVPQPDGSTTSNKPSVINFITPKEGEEFTGTENKISWNATDVDGIKSVKLAYSKDGNVWTNLTEYTSPILNEYVWDVTSVGDGDYYLQLIVIDNIGNEVSRISKKFSISNNSTGPDQTNNPLIINLKPQNNSEITEKRPEISGDFIPADNAEIVADSFTIKLNGVDNLLDCQNDDKSFSCRPKDDLSDGLNKLTATVKDSADREVVIEWSFSIVNESVVSTPVETPNTEETIIILGREIPRNIFNIILIVCCIAGLLILIPWVLYLLWTGRRREEEEVTETSTTTFNFDEPVQTTQKEVSTIQPVESSNYYTPENYSYPGYTYTPEPVKTETKTETTFEPAETYVAPTYPEVSQTAEQVLAEPVAPLAEEKTPLVASTPEVKVEEKVDSPIVTNNTTIDDYYSYVNPSGNAETTPTKSVTPDIPTSTEVKTTTGHPQNDSTEYVEPKETD